MGAIGSAVCAAALAGSVLATQALATETITGRASVIDGDTVELRGERIRLHGIDAPESAQRCQDEVGRRWACGRRAALALADRVGTGTVTCEAHARDRYGRAVAVCSQAGADLNAWLVAEGWAMAYRRYTLDYVDEEAAAQGARIGIWRGPFVPPWDYRAGERLATAPPDGQAVRCGAKTTCGEMRGCGEAVAYLQQCGLGGLDSDGDGVPCEALCR